MGIAISGKYLYVNDVDWGIAYFDVETGQFRGYLNIAGEDSRERDISILDGHLYTPLELTRFLGRPKN